MLAARLAETETKNKNWGLGDGAEAEVFLFFLEGGFGRRGFGIGNRAEFEGERKMLGWVMGWGVTAVACPGIVAEYIEDSWGCLKMLKSD